MSRLFRSAIFYSRIFFPYADAGGGDPGDTILLETGDDVLLESGDFLLKE